jgi:hypothetical protein
VKVLLVAVLVMISLLVDDRREAFMAGKKCGEPDVHAAKNKA